ncbi:hypothetical protein V6N11_073233 [Hibiscus sabdariffa]|uniref:Uncharacterized protein n=2 Tax=Hibiscus sabdariffa TaxID=183260 RepID=A0ABR2AIA1_9ROSI
MGIVASGMYKLLYMYSNALSVTTTLALLNVLMATDGFEVASCMRYCIRFFRNLPMTPESALLYSDLPSSVSIGEVVRPVTDAARHYVTAHYKDMTKLQEEVMALPLARFESIPVSQ